MKPVFAIVELASPFISSGTTPQRGILWSFLLWRVLPLPDYLKGNKVVLQTEHMDLRVV
jgi:hypothetical protein